MDDCKDYFAMLSEYLDGELSAEQCVQMEQHLKGCEPCIAFVESLRQTIALCRDTGGGATPVPEAAKDALREAYRKSLTTLRGA